MRKPVLPVLFMAALVQSGAGCIITSDDDDDGGDGNPPAGILVQINWLCPSAADRITITATPAGSSTSLTPDTFDCDVGAFDLLLDAGDWDIDVVPEGDVDFLGQFDTVDGVDGDLFERNFVFPDDGGYLFLSWTIDGLEAPDGCNTGETVEVNATDQDTLDLLVAEFACEDGQGVVPPDDLEGWPLTEYVLDVALIDPDGNAISAEDPITDVFIDFGDQLVDIGNVDLIPL